METGWKHQSHEIQREFERIRKNTSAAQTPKAAESSAGGAAPAQQTPQQQPTKVKGAIKSEQASPPIYDGFRLQSPNATCEINKEVNAPDRLFVFKVDRPLTVEKEGVAVIDQTIPTNLTNTVAYLNFVDQLNGNGVKFVVDKHKETGIRIRGDVRYQGLNVAMDNISFDNNQTEATLLQDQWTTLCWHNQNIPNANVYDVPGTAIPFYFKHNYGDAETRIYLVSVRVFVVSRDPTNNALPAAMFYPQIALFIDDDHYRTIDVDVRENEYAVLRQALIDNSLITSAEAPESGSKAYLEGTALVQLRANLDKLNVRFRHESAGSKYIKLVEGSIDITEVGINNTIGVAPLNFVTYDQN